jgi:hypothetical protein
MGRALVCNTANVWGNTAASTKKRLASGRRQVDKLIAIASAAAVPSSSSEALAIGKPVSSLIRV